MKTLMIASGPYHWASARLRMYWPAKYMMHTDVTTIDEYTAHETEFSGYDNYIFQKWVKSEQCARLEQQGKRLFWDMCDPLHWLSPHEARAVADHMEKIVCSSDELAEDVNQWYGKDLAMCIPDRLELSHYPLKRQHADVSPVRFIWYGVAQNRIALYGGLINLERLAANGYHIELTIFDNAPDQPFRATNLFPVYHTEWSLEQENEVLAAHDIAFLPPYPGAWGKVKSNNKILTACANGLPITNGQDYKLLEILTLKDCRNEVADFNSNLEPVELSARAWEEVLNV